MADEVSKVLERNDIEDRLVVTRGWMDILRPQFRNGENEALIRAFYWHGSVWEFRCVIRPGPRASLQALEWKKFITYSGIQEGDRLILQAEENLERGTYYNIRAQRMDAHGVWANVPPPAPVVRDLYHFNI